MSILSIQLSEIDNSSVLVQLEADGVGQVEGQAKLPFEKDVALHAILKILEATEFHPSAFYDKELTWLRQEGYIVGSQEDARFSPQMHEKVGKKLFSCLFSNDKLCGIYDQVRRQCSGAEEIHFQLRFPANAILMGAYPWELLYHEGNFLIGGGKGTLTRYITFDAPPPMRPVAGKLKILLIAPRPSDPRLKSLGYAEAKAIYQAVESAQQEEQIQLEPTVITTFDVLEDYLFDHTGDDAPHVIHFDGHGTFGRLCKRCGKITTSRQPIKCSDPTCAEDLTEVEAQGYLIFQRPNGRPEYVSAQTFADLLRQHSIAIKGSAQNGLRLVVLSACRSGVAREGENIFNGVAQRLMDANVPAVVAMQFTVDEDQAAKFANYFYKNIAKHESLVTSVSWGRTRLGHDGTQWYRPVLYLRWRDNEGGQLLNGQNFVGGTAVVKPKETMGQPARPSITGTGLPAKESTIPLSNDLSDKDLKQTSSSSKMRPNTRKEKQNPNTPDIVNLFEMIKQATEHLNQLGQLAMLIKAIDGLIIKHIPKCSKYIQEFSIQCKSAREHTEDYGDFVKKLQEATRELSNNLAEDVTLELFDVMMPPTADKEILGQLANFLKNMLEGINGILEKCSPLALPAMNMASMDELEQTLDQLRECNIKLDQHDTLHKARVQVFKTITTTVGIAGEDVKRLNVNIQALQQQSSIKMPKAVVRK